MADSSFCRNTWPLPSFNASSHAILPRTLHSYASYLLHTHTCPHLNCFLSMTCSCLSPASSSPSPPSFSSLAKTLFSQWPHVPCFLVRQNVCSLFSVVWNTLPSPPHLAKSWTHHSGVFLWLMQIRSNPSEPSSHRFTSFTRVGIFLLLFICVIPWLIIDFLNRL